MWELIECRGHACLFWLLVINVLHCFEIEPWCQAILGWCLYLGGGLGVGLSVYRPMCQGEFTPFEYDPQNSLPLTSQLNGMS